jgi:RNA polymerase sigma factor (sigma-70 family)
MSKIVSNADIMKMFQDIGEFRANSALSEAAVEVSVLKLQDNIINKLSFLVYNQTRQYKKFPNYDDLVQEGFIGLIKSVRKFKWEMFPNFFVYSNQWIRHYVKRAASKFDVVYNPDRTRVIYSEPDDDEIDKGDTPEEAYFNNERSIRINEILDGFPEREREIVRKIFGLNGQGKQTLREIGPQFNMTYERVRQIKNNVLNKLRKNQELNEMNKD